MKRRVGTSQTGAVASVLSCMKACSQAKACATLASRVPRPEERFLRLLAASLARQADFCVVNFLLDLCDFGMIQVARRTGLVFLQRTLPLRDCFADFAFAEVNVAQMIVHCGVARHRLQSPPQLLFGLWKFILAVQHPTQAVEVRAVVRLL